jgi:hypothetical protein
MISAHATRVQAEGRGNIMKNHKHEKKNEENYKKKKSEENIKENKC